jgi:secreted protein with Ig-like and vWFA domain/lipopolysaccharide export system protein LptA
MNPEDLTTHALGEPLPPADQAALDQALTSDAQARADFEATQAFTQFLQQNLATDHPEATLTDEQKQRLLDHRDASGSLARTPSDRANRPTTLRWLTRAILPLSAAALIVLGFQQWREEGHLDVSQLFPQRAYKLKTDSELNDPITIQGKKRDTSPPLAGNDIASPPPTPEQYKLAERAEASADPFAPSEKPRAHMLNEVNQASEAPIPIASATATASTNEVVRYENLSRPPPTPLIASAPHSEAFVGQIQLPGAPTTDSLARRRELGNGYVDLNEPRILDRATHPRQDTPTNESYTPIQENALTAVLREPLSTFSIDVDTAAYANARRFLNRSSLPPRDAVRIEELVNYFPYNLEGPALDSPHPFAVHVEVADCPWQPQHRLARIGIQGKKVGLEERNSNFVFLVDVSGSMNQPDKLPLVKESLRLLVEQLDEKDRVSLVTYAGSSGLVLPPTNGDQKERILAAIANMTSGGSTHGSAGIQLAYEQAIAGFIPEGVNRVILCSDGDFNVGVSSPEELEKLITEKARSGVFLSVLGYGTGNLKDRTMETLADKGNGNYGYIDSLSEARKVLVEQMTGTLITIAKDVKIQVEFNPAQVASYRLIGYENRLLAKEDFNDDTKDAGEIGAGHSVTALYELVPVGLTPPTAPVDDLKYQSPTTAAAPAAEPASPELLTVKLRYKAPEGATSQLIEVPVTDKETTLAAASPEFKFTTAVAAYGLMLRQSSYRGTLTWDQIRQLALEGKGSDPHGYRAEFLQLLDKARGLLPQVHASATRPQRTWQSKKTVVTLTGQSTFDAAKSIATFTENVRVYHPDFYLECDELELVIAKQAISEKPDAAPKAEVSDSETSAESEGKIEKLFARGSMVLIEKYQENGKDIQVGKCKNLTYDGKTGLLTLSVWPQMQRGAQMQVALDASTVMTLSSKGEFHTKGRSRTEIIQGEAAEPKTIGLHKTPKP